MSARIVPDFFADAAALRAAFEAGVGPERTVRPERFVWEYWHVPDQYTYLHTFARRFFSGPLYQRLTAALQQWGQAHLGCSRISEPWLSYYVEGCRQELHADVPQGPWAFVLSLTRWDERRFSGGETLLLRARVLDYWRHLEPGRPLELDALVERVPARFNQLTVFDARVPHGVAPVEGTRDPLESRVVLHGWFLPPRLQVEGALGLEEVEPVLERARARWHRQARALGRLHGLMTVRLEVGPRGGVRQATVVASTLVPADSGPTAEALALQHLRALRFPPARSVTSITLPFSAEGP